MPGIFYFASGKATGNVCPVSSFFAEGCSEKTESCSGYAEGYPENVGAIMNGKNLRNSLQNCRRKAAPLQRVDIIKYLYGTKTAVVEHLLLHQPQAVAHTLHVDSVLQLEHNLADMQGLHLGNGRLVGA